jgi:hypothetical protein
LLKNFLNFVNVIKFYSEGGQIWKYMIVSCFSMNLIS